MDRSPRKPDNVAGMAILRICAILAPMRIEHSYGDLHGGRWLKGNLHTHTNRSDGASSPQAVVDDYAAAGYQFLMISDHDRPISADELSKLQNRGLILLPGNEISANGVHMLHVNGQTGVSTDPNRQIALDAIAATPDSFGIINHPNWFAQWDHCTQDKLTTWQGYAGIEIYNGVVELLEGSAFATDRWDRLLSTGRRIWGFANDDSHHPGHIGLAWNAAYVTDFTPAGVIEALRSGRFYGSTGVEIDRIGVVERTRIYMSAPNADRIIMYGKHQRRLAVIDGNALMIPYPDSEPYVRFECPGRGGRVAWTQPFFRAE